MKKSNQHKRNYSDIKISKIKPIASHRKTSSTQFIASPSVKPSSKNTEFLSLLDAVDSYFKEEESSPIVFPSSPLDALQQSLSLEQLKQVELENLLQQKQEEMSKLSNFLEEASLIKKTLDSDLKTLKIYNHTLDMELSNANNQLMYFESSINTIPRTQQPSPVPIKYKPKSTRKSSRISVIK